MVVSDREATQEGILILRCSQGDRTAFDLLWQQYRRRIFNFIYIRVGDPEEADDLSQEVFIRVWAALSRGTQVGSFAPYLYQVARNVVSDWSEHRHRAVVLEAIEDQKGQAVAGPSVEQVVEAKWSWEFLSQQLDEVLLYSTESPEGRKSGYLRKLAFLSFYMGGLTLPQIQSDLTFHAQALELSVPTLTQLNNWLSRGDILSSLVRHLIQDHLEWIEDTVNECLESLALSEKEATIVQCRWQRRLAMPAIAEQTCLPISEVSQTMEQIIRRLVPQVVARLKANLHEARKQS